MVFPSRILLALTLCSTGAHFGFAAALDPSALIGKWNYTSFTMIKNGKATGTAHFTVGTMVFTYFENGTWEMQAADANRTHLTGTYTIRENELIMKKTDGSLYQDVQVEMSSDGRDMTLRDKRSVVTATKVGAAAE